MSKFVIECPNCGAANQASNSFFSKKFIKCACGQEINVKSDNMKTVVCSKCKNAVVYDQSKGKKAVCPICKESLATLDKLSNTVTINCPSCSCEIVVDKDLEIYECPLCETEIKVQSEIKKQAARKEGVISVLKYEGDNETIVWKHPIEDFNSGSKLIVHESQQALLLKEGKIVEIFDAGNYTLTTDRIPVLNGLSRILSGGKEIYHAEIYFVNKAEIMGIKWGTDSKVRMLDPISGMSVELGACGQFSIKVINSKDLLINVVGTTGKLSQEDLFLNEYSSKGLSSKFKGIIVSKVKTYLTKIIKENKINILEIDENIELISNTLKEVINDSLVPYGLSMSEFSILSILTPDDDPNFKRMKEQYAEQYLLVKDEIIKNQVSQVSQERKVLEAQANAKTQIIAAQGEAEAYRLKAEAEAKEMQMKGYTYQDETHRKVSMAAMESMKGSATGEISKTVSSIANLGVSLGVVKNVADTVENVVNKTGNIVGNTSSDKWECPNCHTKDLATLFCPNCGTKKNK